MDEAFEIEAQALAQVLDELDYFQVLKIGQNASPPDIKSAYYRESRAYHPDRFSTLPAGSEGEHRPHLQADQRGVRLPPRRHQAHQVPCRRARPRAPEEAALRGGERTGAEEGEGAGGRDDPARPQ